MSLVYLIKKEEIKKIEKTSTIIFITFLIVAALAIIGLIYYGATAAYWGTVVDKYIVEEKTVVEYDETLDAEITKIYPARYIVVIESEENEYYQFEVTKYRFNDIPIGNFISTGAKANAERIENYG